MPRIRASDKRIFGGATDVNQMLPLKYPWAWDAYLKSNNQHWLPGHYPLKSQSNRALAVQTDFDLAFAYLTCTHASATLSNELTLYLYRNTTAPECRQYLLRMMEEDNVAQEACLTAASYDGTQQALVALSDGIVDALRQDVTPHLVPAMTAVDYAMVLGMIAMSKLSLSLSKAEDTIAIVRDNSLKGMISRLFQDNQRQLKYLTKHLETFQQEEPETQALLKACLTSWTGGHGLPGIPYTPQRTTVYQTCLALLTKPTSVATSATKTPLDWD